MCYKVANKANKQQLTTELDADFEETPEENWEPQQELSGFAHPKLPVLTLGTKRKLSLMCWGLIPHWVVTDRQASELAQQTLNARAETMFDKPSFREAAAKQRCVIPVTGFYEWQTQGRTKIPYFIRPKTEDLFLFGGLYSTWASREIGELLHTFSIVTVAANPLMAEIHNTKQRMPLILHRSSIDRWMDPANDSKIINELTKPFPDALMFAENTDTRNQPLLF